MSISHMVDNKYFLYKVNKFLISLLIAFCWTEPYRVAIPVIQKYWHFQRVELIYIHYRPVSDPPKAYDLLYLRVLTNLATAFSSVLNLNNHHALLARSYSSFRSHLSITPSRLFMTLSRLHLRIMFSFNTLFYSLWDILICSLPVWSTIKTRLLLILFTTSSPVTYKLLNMYPNNWMNDLMMRYKKYMERDIGIGDVCPYVL